MKNIIFSTLILIVFMSVGCSNDDESEMSVDIGARSISKVKDCDEPSNPYGDGGGHDAGFNWAEETGGSCNGNSQSFNEGCEEYYKQVNEYESCTR